MNISTINEISDKEEISSIHEENDEPCMLIILSALNFRLSNLEKSNNVFRFNFVILNEKGMIVRGGSIKAESISIAIESQLRFIKKNYSILIKDRNNVYSFSYDDLVEKKYVL